MNRLPDDLLGRAGYFQADASCVLVDGKWKAIRASANTALDAMVSVLAGEEPVMRFADLRDIMPTAIRLAVSAT